MLQVPSYKAVHVIFLVSRERARRVATGVDPSLHTLAEFPVLLGGKLPERHQLVQLGAFSRQSHALQEEEGVSGHLGAEQISEKGAHLVSTTTLQSRITLDENAFQRLHAHLSASLHRDHQVSFHEQLLPLLIEEV